MRARTAHERAVITVCAQTLCDGVAAFLFLFSAEREVPKTAPDNFGPTSRRECAV